MRALVLLFVLGCAGCGREVDAQHVGPIGLTSVAVDNDTIMGNGTSVPLSLGRVYVSGKLSGTGSAGSPLETTWIGAAQHIFGDCSDGDVTISSPTTLSRNMSYNNLTVDSTLNSGGFLIRVCGTLTFNGAGVIHRNGGNGVQGSTTDVAGPVQTFCGGGGTSGGGGTAAGGAARAAGSWIHGIQDCDIGSVAAGANGGRCQGGGGGSGASGAGAGNPAWTASTAADGYWRVFRNAIDCKKRGSSSPYRGGSGGGGGRGDAANARAGGSGGSGAGYVVVLARQIVENSCHANGCVQARGGNGGAGAAGGDTGGGGGGGGGVVVVVVGFGPFPTISASGGVGGAGQGTGTNGGDGGDGFIATYRIGNE